MSINKNEIISDNKYSGDPPVLFMSELSQNIRGQIEIILDELINRSDLSPSDDEFYDKFLQFLEFYDMYQKEVLCASGISIVCNAGCSYCCCHWVEDVNSFEAVIMNRYLRDNHSDIIESIVKSFRQDVDILASLRAIVEEKTAEHSFSSDEIDDLYDILLSSFYQLKRHCALLDEKGSCIIYPVRPLSCRDYFNLRDSAFCQPERINKDEHATLIIYPPEAISDKLEILHQRFDDGSNNMSLRSLLLTHLE